MTVDADRAAGRTKPEIIDVIGARIELRPAGREFHGLCPFHDDHHPSLRVNPEKAAWYCHPCAEGGDVIKFIMRLDGLTFPQALAALGIDGNRPRALRRSPNQRAATMLVTWLNRQHLLIGARCREVSRQIALAQEISNLKLMESLDREWEILASLHEDLINPVFATEFWESRDGIESLTRGYEEC